MKTIPKETQILRSKFLYVTRTFLHEHLFLEVDTPIFKPIVGMEPYLDPFLVSSPSKEEVGFLITSPEYSLKASLASGLERIYEITHTFRSGEKGSPIHTSEFLMLELYVRGFDDHALMQFVKSYFEYLFLNFSFSNIQFEFKTVEQVFIETTGQNFSKASLLWLIHEHHLTNENPADQSLWPYEDLFFLVFLNLVEPHLNRGILFLYDYPPECAALARVIDGKARRFEIYWDGVEIANSFWELTQAEEQRARFESEQKLRAKLGKEVFPIDEDFMEVLSNGTFPDCSGVSLGLDRIFMKLLGQVSLRKMSPYDCSLLKNQ
jgi:lysyl-tRNA synthetase class 2